VVSIVQVKKDTWTKILDTKPLH